MKICGNNRGMALLLTLSVITLLMVATLEFNRKMRATVHTTASTRDRIFTTQMATSGIHLAMAALVKDKMDSETDSIQEDWADSEKLGEIFKDVQFENGKVAIKITDELSKIQVNAIVKFPDKNAPNDPQMFLWERYITNLTADNETVDMETDEEIDPRAIINSLKDWLDSGDDEAVTGLTGAESDYYQDLDPPYFARNDRMPHLSDLALVKGVTSAFLDGVEEAPGASESITVHGAVAAGNGGFGYPGRINIGTAQLPVLAALMPVGSEEVAQAIFDYREETSDSQYVNDISSPTWYTNVPGASLLGGSNAGDFKNLITTSSNIFNIEAVATLNDVQRVTRAVVTRVQDKETGKWKCQILSWRNR